MIEILAPKLLKNCLLSPRYSPGRCSIVSKHTGKKNFELSTNTTIFGITCGVGGSEAMLFAQEMLAVYLNYFSYMRWPLTAEELDKGSVGIRSAKLEVTALGSYQGLIQEAGVHRVQRVPKTEKKGRLHTSTISISVLPKSVMDVKLDPNDLELRTKTSSGPGGQFVNKIETAVRILHKPTGLVAECQESRSQMKNKEIAMSKLISKIQEIELNKITSRMENLKKSQVGNSDRNEKIRTYNFHDDRITDHRIGKSYHSLQRLFEGDMTVLQKIINDYNAQ